MEDVCSDLDKLTVAFFDNLELLREKREHLNGAIRDGHLNLSKARYSMGNKSVGTLQYSHKMDCALYHVRDDFPDEQPVESSVAFELLKTSPGRHIEKPESVSDDIAETKSFIRRRKPEKRDSPGKDEDLETSAIEEFSLSRPKETPVASSRNSCVQDPIKWFGILVPGCLKAGQRDFQKAIELSCEVVNLEAKAREIIGKFEVLKVRKLELQLEEDEKRPGIEA